MSALADLRRELPGTCRILAVSKLQPAASIRALAAEGQKDFGENYPQEARAKQTQLQDLVLDWHFIGRLQKNKAKDVVGHFSWVHSVDSLELARVLNQKASEKGIKQKILLQINLAKEETKGGFSSEQLEKDWPALLSLSSLDLRGLMTMPPLFDNPENARPSFSGLRRLRDELCKQCPSLTELSMGTSHDFRIAAEEGATWVRLGTLLFGERPPRVDKGPLA